MKRTANGSTPRQMAYARKLLNGDGRSKKDIAVSVGFSQTVAENAKAKIETSEGFHNAVQLLSFESGELVTSIMAEFKARGFKKHSIEQLNDTLALMTSVWEKFDKRLNPPERNDNSQENGLRKVLLQKVNKQTVVVQSPDSKPIETIIEAQAHDLDL